MELEKSIADHYTQGALESSILAALIRSGKDPDRLAPGDLAPVDEFHTGGRQATADFAAELDVDQSWHLLDIGSGLGGASRYFAHEFGCRVTGIDLTEEYVRTAEALARRVGLDRQVSYQRGSALDLPFAMGTFDGAYMLHVGMNIEAKAELFAGVRNVLKPSGVFGIYDVMRDGEGELSFPVPWAASALTSFVETPATYRHLLEGAGFRIVKERSRREFAREFFSQLRALAAQAGGPPPLGPHLLMGSTASQKVAHIIDNVERGVVAPVEIVAQVTDRRQC